MSGVLPDLLKISVRGCLRRRKYEGSKNDFSSGGFGCSGFGAVGQAATVIMDATHYNGSFIDGPIGYEVGYWASDPLSIPTGWVEAATAMYTAADGDNHWAQCGSTAMAVNNTGVLVQVGQAYTVSADLGGGAGTLARVRVWATQFSDGTGWKLCLAEANRPGQAGDSYTLFHVDGTPGFAATSYVSGYYIQVSIGGGVGGYYDNIIVTSAHGDNHDDNVYDSRLSQRWI